jgi:hypothetical protein
MTAPHEPATPQRQNYQAASPEFQWLDLGFEMVEGEQCRRLRPYSQWLEGIMLGFVLLA